MKPVRRTIIKKFLVKNFDSLYINPLLNILHAYPSNEFSKAKKSTPYFDLKRDGFGIKGFNVFTTTKFHEHEDDEWKGYSFYTTGLTSKALIVIKKENSR